MSKLRSLSYIHGTEEVNLMTEPARELLKAIRDGVEDDILYGYLLAIPWMLREKEILKMRNALKDEEESEKRLYVFLKDRGII